MDSITQMALGAAVGEAVLGKKAGYKAAVWGAVLGTVPDLDILMNPFIDAVLEIRLHRSFSHSITFAVLASPLFGYLINRFHSTLNAGWFSWTKLAFFAFITHILIDIPTSYGTQALFPFTDTPYTTDSIFIIDPLYTLPLLIGLFAALFFKQTSQARRIANYTGLAISSLYMMWGLGIKTHVHSVFDASFKNQYGAYEMIKTMPTGPTTFLWSGYVLKNDTLHHSVYSIFDESKDLQFRSVPRNTHLIEPHIEDRALNTLLWFSRGYYTAQLDGETLVFYDLRFGRSDLWLGESENAGYVWRNEIQFNDEGEAHTFELSTPSFDTRSGIFSRYWQRIWGE